VFMKRLNKVALVCMLLSLSALVAPLRMIPAAQVAQAAASKLVLAVYYPWYETSNWSASKMSALPLNSYSSDDPATTARQVQEAHDAGINAFVSSWSGPDGRIDNNFATLLDVAEKRGDFKAAVYFETGQNMLQGRDNVIKYLAYVRDHYMGRPGYLRSNGHPVVFFWAQQAAGSLNDWQFIRAQVDPGHNQIWIAEGDKSAMGWLDTFDGLHDYGAAKWVNPPTRAGFANWDKSMAALVADYNHNHGSNKLWVAGVQPGYDDSRIRSGNPVRPRNNGQYYNASFDGAIDANPDWIVIVTYNEWFEGSQIEPGQGYDSTYLDLTRIEATKYLGSGPQATPPPPPAPPPSSGNCNGANQRLFPETGFCVQGSFLSYWYANGGLAQFGYPISAQQDETSKTDGKVYAAQWFERARFEWHPEYGNGGEVALGFLGVEAAQGRGHKPDDASFHRTASNGQGQYFAQTGHNLAHGFAQYWQTHGGLTLYGYPISEEFVENLNGKPYIVQYFQRARFELHPELSPAYLVSLGQLGRELGGK
jgi:hypothetical protein